MEDVSKDRVPSNYLNFDDEMLCCVVLSMVSTFIPSKGIYFVCVIKYAIDNRIHPKFLPTDSYNSNL